MFTISCVYRSFYRRLFHAAILVLLISLLPYGSAQGQSSSKEETKLSYNNNNGENFTITNAQGDVLMQLENTGASNENFQNGNAKLTVDGSIELGDVANEEKLNILDLGNGENITIGATQDGMKLRIPNSFTGQRAPRSVVIEGDGGARGLQNIELFRVNNDGTFGLGTDNNIQGNADGLTLMIPSFNSSQRAPRSVVIEADGGSLNSQGTEIASFNNDGTFQLGTGNKILSTLEDGVTISLPSLASSRAPRSVVIEAGGGGSASPTTQILFEVANSGNVGIGTSNPGNILTVVQGSATDPVADDWALYSSRRWKTNIKTIENALDKVQQLRGVTYDWKSDGKHDIGLIAEDVGAVIPEVVVFEENGVDAKSVGYSRLVAVLIEAVKEQQQTIDQLKKQNASAESELLQTKTALNNLETKLAGVEELAAKMSRLEAAMQRLEAQNVLEASWNGGLNRSE